MLLVESHPDLRDLFTEYLNRAGFIVVPAYNGDTATLLAGRLAIHLALIDLVPPTSVGLGLLARLKRQRPDVGVVLLVPTKSGNEVEQQYQAAGADAVVRRPLEDLATLAVALTRALEASERRPRRRPGA